MPRHNKGNNINNIQKKKHIPFYEKINKSDFFPEKKGVNRNKLIIK